MSCSLSRFQAAFLGLLVLLIGGAAVYALSQIGEKQGLFSRSFEVRVVVADAAGVDKGTPVNLRGIEAGQVVAVEYPETDDGTPAIRLRLSVRDQYRGRIYNDARVRIVGRGLLGTNALAIDPGKPASEAYDGRDLVADKPLDIMEVAEEARRVVKNAGDWMQEVRTSKGSLNKLIHDDGLYREMRGVVKQANDSFDDIKIEATSTLRAIRNDAEGLRDVPLIGGYIQNSGKALIRPDMRNERDIYGEDDLFEPGRAVLTEGGREKLRATAEWIRTNQEAKTEIVVVTFADPKNKASTREVLKELTKKQSEVAMQYLREQKAHSLGRFYNNNRVCTALGMGVDPTPIKADEGQKVPRTEVILWIPIRP